MSFDHPNMEGDYAFFYNLRDRSSTALPLQIGDSSVVFAVAGPFDDILEDDFVKGQIDKNNSRSNLRWCYSQGKEVGGSKLMYAGDR